MKLAYADQMRKLDAAAINDYRIPGIILMENAGTGTVRAITDSYGDLDGSMVMVVVGPGNNGGDGLVIARHILQQGGIPIVFLLVDPGKITGDAATNLKIVNKLDILLYPITSGNRLETMLNCLPDCSLVVDAIFGTGLKRAVTGHFSGAIDVINQSPVPVVSVDIPSGLDSDTGQPLGNCINADLTITYGLAKPGHFIGQGPRKTGELGIVDIGIPPEAVTAADIRLEVLENQLVSTLVPYRPVDSHKGTFGHLALLAGSSGKTGAAMLCARGALRSGAGLVTLCIPDALNHIIETAMAEVMTVPLPASGKNHVTATDYKDISKALRDKEALVIGPGLGQETSTGKLVAKIYQKIELPVVVDADALTLLAQTPSIFKEHPGARILTPHPGEMASLTGRTVDEIQNNRLETAREFAAANDITLVLKGAGTIIAAPDGRIAINTTGNPLLAAGGSGDVLAGMLGSMLAQGLPPWEASCLAVYLHGMAADHLGETENVLAGLLASELADVLPAVFAELAGC